MTQLRRTPVFRNLSVTLSFAGLTFSDAPLVAAPVGLVIVFQEAFRFSPVWIIVTLVSVPLFLIILSWGKPPGFRETLLLQLFMRNKRWSHKERDSLACFPIGRDDLIEIAAKIDEKYPQ